jgi:hypothetical protein
MIGGGEIWVIIDTEGNTGLDRRVGSVQRFCLRRPRSKPKTLPATCEERPVPGQEGSARRPTCGREMQDRQPPALGDKIAGRARSSACEIHRSGAGDNALKDEG